MTKVYVRVCYLCYQIGELEEATQTYQPQDEEFDICDSCAKKCNEQGFDTFPLIGETEIEE